MSKDRLSEIKREYDEHNYFMSYAEYCYEKGKADRDREIAEHSVFFSNRPIEDIVLEARADERIHIVEILFGIDRQIAELVKEILLKEQK